MLGHRIKQANKKAFKRLKYYCDSYRLMLWESGKWRKLRRHDLGIRTSDQKYKYKGSQKERTKERRKNDDK